MSGQDGTSEPEGRGLRRSSLWLALVAVVVLFGGAGVMGIRAGEGPGMAISWWLFGAFICGAIIFSMRFAK